MCLQSCPRPWCRCRGGGGCRRRMQAGMLVAWPKAWPGWACGTCKLLAEHVVDAGKGLRVLFGHGGFISQCGGRGGLVAAEAVVWRWRSQHQLRCQASTTTAPALIYRTCGGHGKVQQHIKGPSVWSGLSPLTVRCQRRHSARPYDACRARARPRRLQTAESR
jgi:hypothetical protein